MAPVPRLKIPASAYRINLSGLAALKTLKPKADFPMIDSFPNGSPLGGFGAGTFSRSPYGDFNIWHLFPGVHINETLEHCALAVWRKTAKRQSAYPLSLKNTVFPGKKLNAKKCVYSALYPKSWYSYAELDTVVEQFSPILPHNYRETAYPAACFNVHLRNRSKTTEEISILFSWQNILGWGYTAGNNPTEQSFCRTNTRRWNERASDGDYQGLVFKSEAARGDTLNGEMCLAVHAPAGAVVSFCTQYDTAESSAVVWEPFAKRGVLSERSVTEYVQPAGAIAVKVTLNPGETLTIPFALTWDIPYCLNSRIAKYYTKYWNTDGSNAFALAKEALSKQKEYSAEIDRWQAETAHKIPRRIAGQLFNELYYLADGGSIWNAATELYAYLECFDYPFYETLDVRFYGAFPLAKFWPEIEKNIMRKFTQTVAAEDSTKINYHAQAAVQENITVSGVHNKKFIRQDFRKRRFALPHDLGSPTESPWEKINAYTWQNANRWKDLNSKYVLQIYRAYYYSGKKDHVFLEETWEGVAQAIKYFDQLDIDNDGLPENEAFPDQTFDNWLMRGTSAYCGILRLAALQAGIQIASVINKKEQAAQWRLLLKKAKDSLYKKLWNGKYFCFDETSNLIMSAQLSGQWFLEQLHLPAVLDNEHIDTALKNIYQHNFLGFHFGQYGLVNGRLADGLPVKIGQGDDCWTGINYMLAGHLLLRGKRLRAEYLLHQVIKFLHRGGMLFRTPEAWDTAGNYTASMYMRPGVIWALADWY